MPEPNSLFSLLVATSVALFLIQPFDPDCGTYESLAILLTLFLRFLLNICEALCFCNQIAYAIFTASACLQQHVVQFFEIVFHFQYLQK